MNLLGPSESVLETLGPMICNKHGHRLAAPFLDETSVAQEYQDFFGLWKDADADITIPKAAKTEYAKLR